MNVNVDPRTEEQNNEIPQILEAINRLKIEVMAKIKSHTYFMWPEMVYLNVCAIGILCRII